MICDVILSICITFLTFRGRNVVQKGGSVVKV